MSSRGPHRTKGHPWVQESPRVTVEIPTGLGDMGMSPWDQEPPMGVEASKGHDGDPNGAWGHGEVPMGQRTTHECGGLPGTWLGSQWDLGTWEGPRGTRGCPAVHVAAPPGHWVPVRGAGTPTSRPGQQQSQREPGETREEHIGRVLAQVAPSMLLCSISEVICFLLGEWGQGCPRHHAPKGPHVAAGPRRTPTVPPGC